MLSIILVVRLGLERTILYFRRDVFAVFCARLVIKRKAFPFMHSTRRKCYLCAVIYDVVVFGTVFVYVGIGRRLAVYWLGSCVTALYVLLYHTIPHSFFAIVLFFLVWICCH